jgi:type II secretory pathway pseudopilin PulG
VFRSLDAARISETADRLEKRIVERFPGSGLSGVAESLRNEVLAAADTARWLSRPQWWVRGIAFALIAVMVVLVVATVVMLSGGVELFSSVSDFLQGIDSAVNEIILMAAASYFLIGWETRRKRRRALRALHVLRSLAHIIDMHQLTKDPERLLTPEKVTPSSPPRNFTKFELTRYLDYCSEMLSVISKAAALYVQNFDDPVTLTAVNDVEQLTGSLSQKLWLKIDILERISPTR